MKLQFMLMAALMSGAPMLVDQCCEEQVYFADDDGDGFGDANDPISSCEQPIGYVENRGDCDDADPTVYPGAREVCDGLDNNCDGIIDEGCDPVDRDGDGFPEGEDCNDRDASIYPGAPEVCDGLDNDCDRLVDEECGAERLCYATGGEWVTGCGPATCDIPCGDACIDCLVPVDYCACPREAPYWDTELGCISPDQCDEPSRDADGDGYPADVDCDDSNPRVNPGAQEICDGIDNNCNGRIDETGCEPVDRDGDGYPADVDCDDSNPRVNPGAVEICDGIDNNCNGRIDETGCEQVDEDGDGFPAGRDCDDTDPTINPAAAEVCDGRDNNCDGQVDEYCAEQRLCEATGGEWSYGCEPVTCANGWDADPIECLVAVPLCICPDDAPYWDADQGCITREECGEVPVDADGDGFPEGRDCDDDDASIYPGAREVCDRLDNDCDGLIDEGCR